VGTPLFSSLTDIYHPSALRLTVTVRTVYPLGIGREWKNRSQPGQTPAFHAQVRRWLQDCWQDDPPPDAPQPTRSRLDALPGSDLKDLGIYLRKKQEIAVRAVKQNWGQSKGLNSEQVDELLLELRKLNLIETFLPVTSHAEWVRLLEM